MLRPQAFGAFWKDYSMPVRMLMGCPVEEEIFEVRTCAFGAALEAIGIDEESPPSADHQFFPPQWRGLLALSGRCPACRRLRLCGDRVMDVEHIVEHLNDAHRWSRERIADWVESIERDIAASAAATTEESLTQLKSCTLA